MAKIVRVCMRASFLSYVLVLLLSCQAFWLFVGNNRFRATLVLGGIFFIWGRFIRSRMIDDGGCLCWSESSHSGQCIGVASILSDPQIICWQKYFHIAMMFM